MFWSSTNFLINVFLTPVKRWGLLELDQVPTWLTRHVTLQMTLAVSNVPGPLEPVTFLGNPIVHMYAITAGHPVVSTLHTIHLQNEPICFMFYRLAFRTEPKFQHLQGCWCFSVCLVVICVHVDAVTIHFLSELCWKGKLGC